MATIENTLIEDFHFLEVEKSHLPYEVAGYVEGTCYEDGTANGYTPPEGWNVSSCVYVPPGTHGAATGHSVVLVWCEPKLELIQVGAPSPIEILSNPLITIPVAVALVLTMLIIKNRR